MGISIGGRDSLGCLEHVIRARGCGLWGYVLARPGAPVTVTPPAVTTPESQSQEGRSSQRKTENTQGPHRFLQRRSKWVPLGCAAGFTPGGLIPGLTVLEGSSEQVLGASSLWLCTLCAFLPLSSFIHSLAHFPSSSPSTWLLANPGDIP